MTSMSLQARVVCALLTVCLTQTASLAAREIDWDKKLKKGYYELSIGHVERAVKMFRGFVKKYPASGACHTALGKALKKQGQLLESKQEFAAATSVDPIYPEGFYELGAMLESESKWVEAASAFKRYLELSPAGSKSSTVKDRLRYCQEQL